MANIGAHAAKQMLDWVLGGASATQPTTRVAALTFGVPTSVSALGEIQINSGYPRLRVLARPLLTPAGEQHGEFTFGRSQARSRSSAC
jgi:hypothetical protein